MAGPAGLDQLMPKFNVPSVDPVTAFVAITVFVLIMWWLGKGNGIGERG